VRRTLGSLVGDSGETEHSIAEGFAGNNVKVTG
jgi:hypothetical protein